MIKIGFVTDSSSDIPVEIAEKYGIEIVPLYIGIDGRTYRDQLEITPDEVFAALKKGKKVTTSAPSAGDFQQVFTRLLEEKGAERVYCITLSSRLSGTYNAASVAKNFFAADDVIIIDSKTSTICLGFILIQAAEALKNGCSAGRIDEIIGELVEKNRFIALLESFEYVFKGGRAVFFGKLFEKAMKLVPILNIGSNGKVRLKKFAKNRDSAFIEIYRQTLAIAKMNSANLVGIFYGQDIEPALELKELISKNGEINIKEILVTRITTVISAHTGPGIIGVAVSPVRSS